MSTIPKIQKPRSSISRILVVDDNQDAAESLGILLRMFGHDVHVTHDGTAALAEAKVWSPEVVLLDIGLPGMDGYQVARCFRENGEAVRLVALTGRSAPEDLQRGQEAGFDAFLLKPASPEDLVRVIAGGMREG